MRDLVIRGGSIVDGNGSTARTGDLAVDDGLITAVGRVTGPGRRAVDADGALVTPSWIAIHTHDFHTHDLHTVKSGGIRFTDGRPTGARPGGVLRSGR
jgi:N-acyl-D-aspartate/D-glutamate deacylase